MSPHSKLDIYSVSFNDSVNAIEMTTGKNVLTQQSVDESRLPNIS